MKVTLERIQGVKERLKLLLFLIENGVDRRQAIIEYNQAKSIYNDLVYVYNLKLRRVKCKKAA